MMNKRSINAAPHPLQPARPKVQKAFPRVISMSISKYLRQHALLLHFFDVFFPRLDRIGVKLHVRIG